MWAPHPEVFTMTASTPARSNTSMVRRAMAWARAWSPPWALRAPQQACSGGTTTSQPFRARMRAVARLWAPKTTDWTQPVSIATRARRRPSAATSAGSGARSAAGGMAGMSASHAGSVPGSSRTSPLRRTSPCNPLTWYSRSAAAARRSIRGWGRSSPKLSQRKSRRTTPPGRVRSISALAASIRRPYGTPAGHTVSQARQSRQSERCRSVDAVRSMRPSASDLTRKMRPRGESISVPSSENVGQEARQRPQWTH
jgi:hypothetical protein